LSVNALMDDFMRTEAMYRDANRSNLGYMRDQLTAQGFGVQADASGRIAGIRPFTHDPVANPDYVGAALRLGGGALDAYSKYRGPQTITTTQTSDLQRVPIDSNW